MSSEDPNAPASSPGTLDYARAGVDTRRDPRKTGRALLKVSAAFAVSLLLLSLWRVHQPVRGPGAECLAMLGVLACGVFWIAGVGASVLRLSTSESYALHNVKWVAIPAVLVLLAALLAMTPIGPWVGFSISRSAFDAAVKNPPPESALPVRVGIYTVDEIVVDSTGGMWFQTGEYHFYVATAQVGFAYQPSRTEVTFGNQGPPRLTSLGGGWYAFKARFD